MGHRTSVSRASCCRTLALLAGAAIALGCVARAQGFEDWNTAWTADVSDRTGGVASIQVLDAAGPGDQLAADAVRLRNLDPTTVEVAWLGGACVACAHFSLAPESGARIDLRYDIGAPCDVPATAGYAVEIRFRHPIDAGSIVAVPDWGP
jgi:hypothetical protein